LEKKYLKSMVNGGAPVLLRQKSAEVAIEEDHDGGMEMD